MAVIASKLKVMISKSTLIIKFLIVYLVDGDVGVAASAEVEDEAGDKGVGLSDLKEARISATLKSHNHLVGTLVSDICI